MSCAISCTDVGTHEPVNLRCAGPHPAGSSSVVIFLCLDNVSDITNPTQINTAIAAGEARLIEGIRFGSGASTPNLSPKTTSCGLPGVLNKTIPLNLTDYNYSQTNNELWEGFGSGMTAEGILAWDCSKTGYDDTSRFYQATQGAIQFQGGLVSPDDDDEAARFELTGNFKGSIEIINTPAGVFS